MPLTLHEIDILRRSFALVEPQAAVAGLTFYRHLFALDPSLRPLFQTSIELQSRKLMEALSCTVTALENPETLIPVLHAMGRRHLAYGAKDAHYQTVVEALLRTLDEILGTRSSPKTRLAWKQALTFVADTMKQGAAAALVCD